MENKRDKGGISSVPAWIFSCLLNYYTEVPVLGDLEEEFHQICAEKGCSHARRWVWMQLFKSCPFLLKNLIYWSVIMFKNHLKITFRNIIKHKGYSFINITGLAIGIASCMLITLWIIDELRYDRFHKDVSSTYQILCTGLVENFPNTPIPLAPTLEEEYPEIKHATRFETLPALLLRNKERKFYENGIVGVDPSFFKIFSFPLVKGDRNTLLKNSNSIVISETVARKFFPDEDPIGKGLLVNNQSEFIVTGVIKDVPRNSTLQFSILLSLQVIPRYRSRENWNSISPQAFIKVHETTSREDINKKIVNTIPNHKKGLNITISVLPFVERYLFFSGNLKYIHIFSLTALFIMLIACINFINLSTARSVNRAKEVSILKVTGAQRRTIVIRFLGESFILSFIALIFAFILIALFLPSFNTLTGKQLNLENPFLIPALLGLALLTGIISGVYPSLFLSSFQPVKVLKSGLKSGSKGFLLRRILVVLQFSISIVLIIGTGVVYNQFNYLKNMDIGYDREHIVRIPLLGNSKMNHRIFKTRMLQDARILNVTGSCSGLPYFSWSTGKSDWEGKEADKKLIVYYNYIDYNFCTTLNIPVLNGKGFSEEIHSSSEPRYLVNQEMAKVMGKKSCVGERLTILGKTGRITGVVKNFNFVPLNEQIAPLVLILSPEHVQSVLVKIPADNIEQSVKSIEKAWQQTQPMLPFEFKFLDDEFNRRYAGISRIGKISTGFSLLAILIACLGLFGLASFTSEQKSKDIGIRKVLGATVSSIVLLLSREFIRCVLLANIIAWPIAYFFMNNWLGNFAFHTHIGIWVFILAGLLVLGISFFTVSYQSIKAALTDPVNALKYE